MLLYNTHGWIHLAIGRPERWFRWGLMEFVCTVTLFLLVLPWGPSGVAFAWTASYFLLMFPGFWYAGKPIGLGIGPILAIIWRFFAGSALAGGLTVLMLKAIHSGPAVSASGALVRMVTVSVVFFSLYLGGVVALHKGFRPLSETAGLIRELLPDRTFKRTSSAAATDAKLSDDNPVWSEGRTG